MSADLPKLTIQTPLASRKWLIADNFVIGLVRGQYDGKTPAVVCQTLSPISNETTVNWQDGITVFAAIRMVKNYDTLIPNLFAAPPVGRSVIEQSGASFSFNGVEFRSGGPASAGYIGIRYNPVSRTATQILVGLAEYIDSSASPRLANGPYCPINMAGLLPTGDLSLKLPPWMGYIFWGSHNVNVGTVLPSVPTRVSTPGVPPLPAPPGSFQTGGFLQVDLTPGTEAVVHLDAATYRFVSGPIT